MTIEEGEKVPPLKMALSDGTILDLGNLTQSVALYFYPKDDTPGCTNEAKDFTALADAFARAGAKVVGVSRDPMKRHDKFIAKYDLKIPLASDEDGRISEAFGTWIEKSMYGRKYMGMERSTFLIDTDGQVRQAWRGVKVKGHAEAVLEALKV